MFFCIKSMCWGYIVVVFLLGFGREVGDIRRGIYKFWIDD
jgi:hypothetical protein